MWREDLDDDAPVRPPEPPDPLTQATGAHWFASRWTVDECRQGRTCSTTTGFPERFDRFYPSASGGPLLVDVLVGDHDMRAEQERSKHVAFKRAWCAAHDRRYLVCTEDDAADLSRCRSLIAALDASDAATPVATARDNDPAADVARRTRRGGVQRPKAATATA